jgi:hypothetical protein
MHCSMQEVGSYKSASTLRTPRRSYHFLHPLLEECELRMRTCGCMDCTKGGVLDF